jgi:hypothetical protein
VNGRGLRGLLVGGLAALAIALIGAAVAGADGYTSADLDFIARVTQQGYHGDPDRLIKTGHVVCELLDDGASKQTITAAIMIKDENGSKYPEFDATLFAQAASWSYCPEHPNEFGNI